MPKAIQFYRLLNTLSLDVVAGAMVCALYFGRIFHVSIGSAALTALLLTVWIIYTADHLRDARRIQGPASTARHRFHQRHFKTILIVLVVMTIFDAVTLFFLDPRTLKWGALLMAVVIIYLISHHYLKYLKEIFIAVMYTCGIILPSWSIADAALGSEHAVLILQFVILALINLLLFSWFDRKVDKQDNQHSFVTIVGDHRTTNVIWFLIGMEIFLTIVQIRAGVLEVPALLFGCMSLALLLILGFRHKLAENDYYRLLGDAVFIIPALYLF